MSKPADEASIRRASQALESCGYVVDRIPEEDTPTPDLLAVDSKSAESPPLAIEVKSNQDPPLEFDASGVAQFSRSTGYSNTLSGVLKKAGRQLAHAPQRALRLVCYCTTGLEPEARADELKATLYGMVDVLAMVAGPRPIPCFYFDRAEFFRQRDVAAALIIVRGGGLLCINEVCPDAPSLRQTALWRWHEEAAGVRDPVAEEKAGRSFRLDINVDRDDEAVVLEQLAKKYATGPLITFRPKLHVAVGVVEGD